MCNHGVFQVKSSISERKIRFLDWDTINLFRQAQSQAVMKISVFKATRNLCEIRLLRWDGSQVTIRRDCGLQLALLFSPFHGRRVAQFEVFTGRIRVIDLDRSVWVKEADLLAIPLIPEEAVDTVFAHSSRLSVHPPAPDADRHEIGKRDPGDTSRPGADISFSRKTMPESFYMSNMSPQTPPFNRDIWSKLEKHSCKQQCSTKSFPDAEDCSQNIRYLSRFSNDLQLQSTKITNILIGKYILK